jgi:RES domain-containing protein
MMPDFPSLLRALPIPPASAHKLRRFVAREALANFTPPNYLYSTGYAYRVNTAGTRGLYGSEDAATAGAEWERQAAKSPKLLSQVLYFIEISLPVVDLGSASALASLQLQPSDLTDPWEFVPTPTKLQTLGDAVAQQNRFGGVRFPSDAARVRGFLGFNIVTFPAALASPMSVVIRDDRGNLIPNWP